MNPPIAIPAADAPAGPEPPAAAAPLPPPRRATWRAVRALLARDLAVLRANLSVFILRTVMQPLLLVFVFTYVFPRVGQGVGAAGGGPEGFSTLLVAGVIATAMLFQGIQAVALPLVKEFGYTREIEDRVLAPLPIWAVAVEKIVAGALQALAAGAVVFPLAAVVPVDPVHLDVDLTALVVVAPLAALTAASLGLVIGTRVPPDRVPLMFSVLVVPMTFLGATYYPWERLTAIPWLQAAVLVNPLVYMSEGFRMALTAVPSMPAPATCAALAGFTLALSWLGIAGFRRRVLT